jgi:hypothetical protein
MVVLMGFPGSAAEKPAEMAQLWASFGSHTGYKIRHPSMNFPEDCCRFTVETMTSRRTCSSKYWGYGVFTGVESEFGWDGAGITVYATLYPIEGLELSLGFDVVRMRPAGTIAILLWDLPER